MSSTAAMELVHLDLASGLPPEGIPGGQVECYVVFWWREVPLGDIHIRPGDRPVTPRRLAELAARAVAPAVGDRLFRSGFRQQPPERLAPRTDPPAPLDELLSARAVLERAAAGGPIAGASSPSTTVIICTRDRPAPLGRCLAAVAELRTAPDEVIVVDNAPTDDATKRVAAAAGVRYVREDRPGLSFARNTGVRASRGEVLAFTDDDATVHPHWLDQLVAGFVRDDVMSVTGLVLPASLDHAGQVVFERHMGGFNRGFRPIEYDHGWFSRTCPTGTPVWKVGAGANMALRRAAFDRVGLFDERLGAGAAGCSEDSELWYRLLAEGWTCRYQPTAVVFHHHRSDIAEVQDLARHYSRGHLAALFVQYGRYRHSGNLRRAFVAIPRHYLRRAASDRYWRRGRSPTLRAEVAGYASGLAMLGYAGPARRDEPTGGRASRRAFLRANPFEQPLTLGMFYREKMRAIHAIARPGPVRRILEVGGGQGGLTRLLYPGAVIVNADYDRAFAHRPVNEGAGSHFTCADGTWLPFRDECFDAVTLFDVLEHIPDDTRAVAEARRVLRPGGQLLLSSPNDAWRFPYYRAFRRVCPTDAEIMADWGHVRRGYALAELDRLAGTGHDAAHTFITPLTVIAHDVAFSRLPRRVRRAAGLALAPLTWAGYALHRPSALGTETAVRWTKR
ncbi:MAG: hypothetical protein CYG61_00795 [Actinobacteria bacterium]|nr:MAG: hypothetical protein CYG61_00795 [Actinomycetota bacterium]